MQRRGARGRDAAPPSSAGVAKAALLPRRNFVPDNPRWENGESDGSLPEENGGQRPPFATEASPRAASIAAQESRLDRRGAVRRPRVAPVDSCGRECGGDAEPGHDRVTAGDASGRAPRRLRATNSLDHRRDPRSGRLRARLPRWPARTRDRKDERLRPLPRFAHRSGEGIRADLGDDGRAGASRSGNSCLPAGGARLLRVSALRVPRAAHPPAPAALAGRVRAHRGPLEVEAGDRRAEDRRRLRHRLALDGHHSRARVRELASGAHDARARDSGAVRVLYATLLETSLRAMRKLVLLLLVFAIARSDGFAGWISQWQRSEEHTSELQSHSFISYA